MPSTPRTIQHSGFPISTDVIYEWYVDGVLQADTDSILSVLPVSGNREIVSRIYILDRGNIECETFDTVQVNYRDNPVADFTIMNACEVDDSVKFVDTSTSLVGNRRWSWDFGDGNTAVKNIPSDGDTFNIYKLSEYMMLLYCSIYK